jgi:hypothetical protein
VADVYVVVYAGAVAYAGVAPTASVDDGVDADAYLVTDDDLALVLVESSRPMTACESMMQFCPMTAQAAMYAKAPMRVPEPI